MKRISLFRSKSGNNQLKEKEIINDVTKSVKNLIAIIKEENELLKIGQISNISSIVEKKVEAIAKFNKSEQAAERYKKQIGDFDQNSLPLKKLRHLFAELEIIRKDSEILIRSNLEVSEQMIEIHKQNKIKETLNQFSYNKNGSISSDNLKKSAISVGFSDKV
jgi:hypothetical protein